MAVSAPKQDIMRTAVAVDGQRPRVGVLVGQHERQFRDLCRVDCRAESGRREVRLTTDPGTDLNPVAATDAKGRVWVAWQGFRNGNLEILASVQQGDSFSPEKVVSFSPRSDWDPAIASGAEWRSGDFMGHLRQGRLRRLLPAAEDGCRHPHGAAGAGRGEPELRSAQFDRVRSREPPVGGIRSFPTRNGARISARTKAPASRSIRTKHASEMLSGLAGICAAWKPA